MLTVTHRQPEDLAACVELLQSTQGLDTYPVIWPKDPPRWLASPKQLAAWVARDGTPEVVGYVAMHPVGNDPAADVWAEATGAEPERMMVVSRLIVSPSRRRTGIGEALLDAASRHAYEHGAVPELDVARHNADAIRLYERLGWRRVGQLELDLGRPITFIAYVGPSASEG
jgi:ribosomal protein S18 acetylase RimI-like enzyme